MASSYIYVALSLSTHRMYNLAMTVFKVPMILLGIFLKRHRSLCEIPSPEDVTFIEFKGVVGETVVSNPEESLRNSMQF
jgi:hypothetical protein